MKPKMILMGMIFTISVISVSMIERKRSRNIIKSISNKKLSVEIWELKSDWSMLLYMTIRFESLYVAIFGSRNSDKSVLIF